MRALVLSAIELQMRRIDIKIKYVEEIESLLHKGQLQLDFQRMEMMQQHQRFCAQQLEKAKAHKRPQLLQVLKNGMQINENTQINENGSQLNQNNHNLPQVPQNGENLQQVQNGDPIVQSNAENHPAQQSNDDLQPTPMDIANE